MYNSCFIFLQTESLSTYYNKKILDVFSGKSPNINKYFPSKKKLTGLKIIEELQDTYVVENVNSNSKYNVYPVLGYCSCPVGINGAPCKHQHFLSLEKEKVCPNIIPTNVSQKIQFHQIAVGNTDIDPNWYSPLILKNNAVIKPNDVENNNDEMSFDADTNKSSEKETIEEGEKINMENSKKKLKEIMLIFEKKLQKKSISSY